MTHIDPKAIICGFPALQVRGVLRSAADPYSVDADLIAGQLHITKRRASGLLAALIEAGYLELAGEGRHSFSCTTIGRRLALANASPQITRQTADRLLGRLVQRIRVLQTHRVFTYRVSEAWVFGSYIKSAERLSDVDVAVRYVGRMGDKIRDNELRMKRIKEVAKRRRFRNISEEYMWPMLEVMQFLRARSSYLELHDLEEEPRLVELPGIQRIFPFGK